MSRCSIAECSSEQACFAGPSQSLEASSGQVEAEVCSSKSSSPSEGHPPVRCWSSTCFSAPSCTVVCNVLPFEASALALALRLAVRRELPRMAGQPDVACMVDSPSCQRI